MKSPKEGDFGSILWGALGTAVGHHQSVQIRREGAGVFVAPHLSGTG